MIGYVPYVVQVKKILFLLIDYDMSMAAMRNLNKKLSYFHTHGFLILSDASLQKNYSLMLPSRSDTKRWYSGLLWRRLTTRTMIY